MRLIECLLGASQQTIRAPRRRLISVLTENEAYKSYSDVWLTATQFLNERSLASSALPAESEEKLLIEALVGAMHQFKPDPKTDPSQQIPGLVAKLQEILGSADTELAKYMRQTIEGLQRLRVQIPADEELPDEPDSDNSTETADAPKDADASKGPEEEKPQDETQGLAAKLGLADTGKTAAPPAKPKPTQQASLDRPLSLLNVLLEQAPAPQPGQRVVMIRDGKTLRRQVVKSDANRATVIDPDEPNGPPEEVNTVDLGPDVPDDKAHPTPGPQQSTSPGSPPPQSPTPSRRA